MALIQAKGRLESAFTGRYFGSATTTANGSGERANFTGLRNMIAGEGITDLRAAVPNGHLAPSAWFLPQVAGGMSSRGESVVTFTGAGNAAQGRNLSGSAVIAFAADGSAAAIAALEGAAAITFAGTASASAVFALEGSSAIVFAGSADPAAVASIAGSAVITFAADAIPLATAWMVATPIETALTADGIAGAVWSATAAGNAVNGTMGEKLNDAGSASNPWTEVIESGFTAAEILRLMAAAMAGKATVESGSVTFRDIGDTKDRIVATVDSSGNRTAIVMDAA